MFASFWRLRDSSNAPPAMGVRPKNSTALTETPAHSAALEAALCRRCTNNGNNKSDFSSCSASTLEAASPERRNALIFFGARRYESARVATTRRSMTMAAVTGVLLPSLRPQLRAPVIRCDGNKEQEHGSSKSKGFFSPFRFFGQASTSENEEGASTSTWHHRTNDGARQHEGSVAALAEKGGVNSSEHTFSDLDSRSKTNAVTDAGPLGAPADSSGQNVDPSKEPKPPSSVAPISYEQFSREWLGVSGQDNFDGFKLEATKQVNKVLTATHTFHLGTSTKESGCSYGFGPTLVLGEPDEAAQQEGQMPKFFGMARLSSDGFLQTRFIKALSKTADIKFNSNSSLAEDAKDKAMYELCFDKLGKDWAANLKLVWQGTWILNGIFSQIITPKLQMGGELTWVTSNGISMANVGARYTFDDNNVTTYQIGVGPDFSSPLGFASDVYSGKAQYVRKVTDRFSIGTEIECSHPEMCSAMRVGWQYLFRHARVQGMVDTAGRVSMCSQDYNGFALSGLIDYWHGDYKFGFQMNVVPPPSSPDQQLSS